MIIPSITRHQQIHLGKLGSDQLATHCLELLRRDPSQDASRVFVTERGARQRHG